MTDTATTTTMSIEIPGKSTTMNGFKYSFELKGVPPQFANGIRRILLNEMPVVEVTNVSIQTNTTLMPNEMLTLRTELLPVNVRPTEEDLIRTAKITLHADGTKPRIYTSDFVTTGRNDILLKDRDLGTPLFFMKMKPDETIHLTAGLRVNPSSSHVCVATYFYHVDEERAQEDLDEFLADNEGWDEAEQVFNNFYRQRSYAKDEKGRPNWFDFTVESIGVIPARELVKDALQILKKGVLEWTGNDIIREKEENVYKITTDVGGHTVGSLVQALLYDSGLCQFVSYDVPHPLRTEMNVRFLTPRTPEEILAFVKTKITELCDTAVSLL
jgi:DNA-directed RNA polymerase subunit L